MNTKTLLNLWATLFALMFPIAITCTLIGNGNTLTYATAISFALWFAVDMIVSKTKRVNNN